MAASITSGTTCPSAVASAAPPPPARARVNHTKCAHRRRVRSASSAPWRHTAACLPGMGGECIPRLGRFAVRGRGLGRGLFDLGGARFGARVERPVPQPVLQRAAGQELDDQTRAASPGLDPVDLGHGRMRHPSPWPRLPVAVPSGGRGTAPMPPAPRRRVRRNLPGEQLRDFRGDVGRPAGASGRRAGLGHRSADGTLLGRRRLPRPRARRVEQAAGAPGPTRRSRRVPPGTAGRPSGPRGRRGGDPPSAPRAHPSLDRVCLSIKIRTLF